jgi:hypothetical protein
MDGTDNFDFFYNDLDYDEDDSMEHVDDERDDCGRDLSDDEGAEKQDPIQLSNVRAAKARLEGMRILARIAAEQYPPSRDALASSRAF